MRMFVALSVKQARLSTSSRSSSKGGPEWASGYLKPSPGPTTALGNISRLFFYSFFFFFYKY